MNTRAKFAVTSIERSLRTVWDGHKSVTAEAQTIELRPVTSGSKENEQFYMATPSGMIELTTINPAAGNTFKLGAEYYVDFSAAASPAAN